MSTSSTSTRVRAIRVRPLLVAALVTGALASPTAFASGADRVVTSGWWWAAQTSPSATLPAPYGTAPGEVYVGRQGLAHEKAAAIRVDVSDLKTPPSVMVVALDEIEEPTSEDPLSGDLLACPIVDTPWEPAQGGTWSARPRGGCLPPGVSLGSRDDKGRWTFDITVMASGWVDGSLPNRGFEIYPAQHAQHPSFEVGLLAPGSDDIYVLKGDASEPPSPPSTEALVPDPPTNDELAPRLPAGSEAAVPAAAPPTDEALAQPANQIASGPAAAAPRNPAADTSITAMPARSSGSADTPVGPTLIALILCVSAAVSWSKVRTALVTRG